MSWQSTLNPMTNYKIKIEEEVIRRWEILE